MKANEIKLGVTYHNGKQGPRSYAARKVLDKWGKVKHLDGKGTESETGVRFVQTAGRHKGKVDTIPMVSFAIWAKGIAEEEKP